jgi:hypothetical protein
MLIEHICAALGSRPLPRATLTRYDRSGSKPRHQKLLREFVGIQPADARTQSWLDTVAAEAARTKTELPDIINVMIEELVRHRYELPTLAAVSRIATRPQPASRVWPAVGLRGQD